MIGLVDAGAAQVAHLCRAEYRTYRDLRSAFFVLGDPQINRQVSYTVMVESIPPEFQSNTSFRDFFDHLFPGQVHPADPK